MAATYNGKIVVSNALSGQFIHRITQDDLDNAISQGLSFGQLSLGEVSADNFTFEDRSPVSPENTVSIEQVPANADLFITVDFGIVQLPDAVVFKHIQGKTEYIATFNGQAIRQSESSLMAITCTETVVDDYVANNIPLGQMINGNIPLNLVQYINGAILSETNTILRGSVDLNLTARKNNLDGYIPLW